MQKVLVAGIDEKILNELYMQIGWGNAGYDAPDLALSEAAALSAIKRTDYDVIVMLADGLLWERIYKAATARSGRVDLILLSFEPGAELYRAAVELSAAGIFEVGEIKSKRFLSVLENIYGRRRSSSLVASFISDENISEQIYFQLNGNNATYFGSLFDELSVLQEDKEVVRAVCIKLMGIIYDYLERQGFKNAPLQRSGAIHKIGEMKHIFDVIKYTKECYINMFRFETEKNQDYYYALTKSIKEYILSNYEGEALGVPKIAERFHFSPNYVNGIFKSQMGETIPSYITNLRLGRAKKLLTETKMPISEIASCVGYSRITYFSRIFKKKYNISPNEYRNKFSEKA